MTEKSPTGSTMSSHTFVAPPYAQTKTGLSQDQMVLHLSNNRFNFSFQGLAAISELGYEVE